MALGEEIREKGTRDPKLENGNFAECTRRRERGQRIVAPSPYIFIEGHSGAWHVLHGWENELLETSMSFEKKQNKNERISFKTIGRMLSRLGLGNEVFSGTCSSRAVCTSIAAHSYA